MRYSIISVDESRATYKENLRKNMKMAGIRETKIASVDGRGKSDTINKMFKLYGLKRTPWIPNEGEAGIWLSNYFHWYAVSQRESPLIVFEDDAIIDENFAEGLNDVLNDLPKDWDFVSLWVPDNQRIDYRYNLSYDETGNPQIYGMRPEGLPSFFDCGAENIAKVYQGYGMVATMYSPTGGKKLLKLVKKY